MRRARTQLACHRLVFCIRLQQEPADCFAELLAAPLSFDADGGPPAEAMWLLWCLLAQPKDAPEWMQAKDAATEPTAVLRKRPAPLPMQVLYDQSRCRSLNSAAALICSSATPSVTCQA